VKKIQCVVNCGGEKKKKNKTQKGVLHITANDFSQLTHEKPKQLRKTSRKAASAETSKTHDAAGCTRWGNQKKPGRKTKDSGEMRGGPEGEKLGKLEQKNPGTKAGSTGDREGDW